MSLSIQNRITTLSILGPEIDTKLLITFERISLVTVAAQGPPGAQGDDGLPGAPGDIGGDPGNLILYFENGLT